MRRISCILAAICALIAIGGGICLAVDDSSTDPRLDMKVTYHAGYKRLHEVTEYFTATTGVKIPCGASPNDWQVRDIPVAVWVDDVPLRDVLRYLADATHTEVHKFQSSSSRTSSYRIRRNPKVEAELANMAESRKRINLQLAGWAWDALAAYGKQPVPLTSNTGGFKGTADDAAEIRSLSQLLSSLSAQTKADVLAGKSVALTPTTVPDKQALRSFHLVEYSMLLRQPGATGIAQMTPEDSFQGFSMRCQVNTELSADRNPVFTLSINIPYSVRGTSNGETVAVPATMGMGRDINHLANLLSGVEGLQLPKKPTLSPSDYDDPIPAGTRELLSEEDWKLPLLQTKVKIPATKKTFLTRAEMLSMISVASGFSIISEDFMSHRDVNYIPVVIELGPEVTLGKALKRLMGKYLTNTVWYLDEANKTIIGRAANWRYRHSNLVPASQIKSLKSRIAGDGADLDDIVPIVFYSTEQMNEWVGGDRDLEKVTQLQMWDYYKELWQLYAILSPRDRELARSPAGISLSVFDSAWVGEILRSRSARRVSGFVDADDKEAALSDPAFLAGLNLRVDMMPISQESYRCSLLISGPRGDRSVMWSMDTPHPFPVYSPARLAEITKSREQTKVAP